MASITEQPNGATGSYPYDGTGADATMNKVVNLEHPAAAGLYPATMARLDPELLALTQPQTRIFLKPLANPSCLGFAAFFGGTWVFSTMLCSWYHEDGLQNFIAPFMLVFGGLAQFIAGFYGFPARDSLATVFHVSWGSFYLSYGLLYAVQLLGFNDTLPSMYDNQPSTATWLVVMAALTWVVTFVSIGRDWMVTAIAFLQAVGSTVMFGGWYSDGSENSRTVKTGGYFMMLAAVVALVQVFFLLLLDGPSGADSGVWWNRVSSWQQNLPWIKGRYAVRIPINEAGIRKAQ